jgi:hypothetical protein
MFIPQSNHVMQVSVDGRFDGQQILNVYHYKYSSPDTGPTAGTSTVFLQNFRTAFRALLAARFYPGYSVMRYWLRSIHAVAVSNPVPPVKWRPVYHPDMLDWLDGVVAPGSDQGGQPVLSRYLPSFVALRVLKNPEHRRVGYLSRNYNRYGPMETVDLDLDLADNDLWSTDTLTNWTTSLSAFTDAAILDQPAGNGWDQAVFSASYHGNVGQPAGSTITKAAEKVTSVSVMQFAGSQVSRRYKPRGGFQGS